MIRVFTAVALLALISLLLFITSHVSAQNDEDPFGHPVIGREVAIPHHLRDGQE